MRAEQVSLDKPDRWAEVLQLCGASEVYHSAAYHQAARLRGEGEPILLYVAHGSHHCALPLLLRGLDSVTTLAPCSGYDATSVYGYPGPVCSIGASHPDADAVRTTFGAALRATLEALGVVSVFSRLNPLDDSGWLLTDLAQLATVSQTVAVDLRLAPAEQVRQMSKGHRYDIRRALREGIVVERDVALVHLPDFVELYEETMLRVGASADYTFAEAYFRRLHEGLGERIQLYVARRDKEIVAAALFLYGDRTVHYHLSGARGVGLSLGGVKAVLDHVRREATQAGFDWLHLGGGVGGNDGSLMRFKAGFSGVRLDFQLARAIIDPPRYRELVAKSGAPAHSTFFPAYRTPAVPASPT